MNKEMILGVVRHVLTFAGGFLITKGIIDESLSQEIIGGVVSLVGLVWSIWTKKQ
jgi:hypothetical protein